MQVFLVIIYLWHIMSRVKNTTALSKFQGLTDVLKIIINKFLNEKFLNKPVRHKLTLMVMFVASISVVITCISFFIYDIQSKKQSMINELSLLIDVIGKRTAPGMEFSGESFSKKANQNLQDLQSNDSIILSCIYKVNGDILATYSQKRNFSCPVELPKMKANFFQNNLEITRDIKTLNGKKIGDIYVKADMHKIRESLIKLLFLVCILVTVVLIIAYFITREVQKFISIPVFKLTQTTQTITENKNYSNRAKKFYNDEIGNLVDNFNKMLNEVEKRDYELATANEQLEEKVKERTSELTDALKAKSNFLSNMSHEIRTPNHAVLNCSKYIDLGLRNILKKLDEYLQKHPDNLNNDIITDILKTASSCHEDMIRIRKSSQYQSDLLNNILDLSKLGEKKMSFDIKNNDIKPIITNSIISHEGFYKGIKDIQITFEDSSEKIEAEFDCARIAQVVNNLLGNAIKYSNNGNIVIKTNRFKENDGNDFLEFSISDDGIGIPEDELEVIFEKFTESSKTKKQSGGTGIGLAICTEIIIAHNGKIWAENKKPNGSVFKFIIPIKYSEDKQNG